MGAADDVATQFDSAMTDVLAFADACDEREWTTLCPSEERTVGVMFDHIAAGNREVVEWIESFLGGRSVVITPDQLRAENAEHARAAAGRPRASTISDLRESASSTSKFLRALSDEQMQVKREFGWAGLQDVAFLCAAGVRHPQRHLKSVREALGR